MLKRQIKQFMLLGLCCFLTWNLTLATRLESQNEGIADDGKNKENMIWQYSHYKYEPLGFGHDLPIGQHPNNPPDASHIWLRRVKRSRNFGYGESSEEDGWSGCRTVPSESPHSSSPTTSMDLMTLLNNGSSYMSNYLDLQDIILVLGNPGSGKTTLTQTINGNLNQLHAVRTTRGSLVIIDEQNKIARPSQISKTVVPELVRGEDGTIFVDCPGFDHTRSPEQDIAANYFMNLILKKAKRVKLLFLVPQSSVAKGAVRIDFDMLVGQATKFLKNIPSYQKSMGLVVTKVDKDKSPMRSITQFLSTYLDDLRSQLRSESRHNMTGERKRKIQFMEALLKQNNNSEYNHISFSQRPNRCGPLSQSETVIVSKARIMNFLTNGLDLRIANSSDFGYTLKRETKSALMNYVIQLNDDATRGVSIIMKNFEIWFAQQASRTRDLSSKLRSLKNLTTALDLTTTSLRGRQNQFSLENFCANLKLHLGEFGYKVPTQNLMLIQQQQNYFNFFDEVNESPVMRSPLEWLVPVEKTKEELRNVEHNVKSSLRRYAESINKHVVNETSHVMIDFEEWFIQEHVRGLSLTDKAEELEVATEQLGEAIAQMNTLGGRCNPKDVLEILDDALSRLGHDVSESYHYFISSQQRYYLLDDEFNPPGLVRDVRNWQAPLKETYSKLRLLEETTGHSVTIQEQNLEIKRWKEDLSRKMTSLSGKDLQIETMQKEIRDKAALITTLRSEILTKVTAINANSIENKRLRDENRNQTLETKRSKEDSSRKATSLSEKDNQITRTKKELSDKTALITTLRSEISTKATAINARINENRRLKDENDKQTLEIKRWKEDLNHKITSLSDKDRQIERMQKELNDKTALIATLRSDISTKSTAINAHIIEIRRLKDENSKLMKDKTELMRQGDANTRELARLQSYFLKDANGDTELHRAVNRGDEQAVKDLVSKGACLDSRNKYNNTPLIQAAKLQDLSVGLEIIKFLIDKGADVYPRNERGNTFLHHFTSIRTTPQQFHNITVYLISKNLSDLFKLQGQYYRTPLLLAVLYMKEDVRFATLSLLIHDAQIDLNKIDMESNNILSLALLGNRTTAFLSKLVELGMNWEHIQDGGRSTVHIAAMGCNVEGLKFLLSKGMNINAVDSQGSTPLHLLAWFGRGDILETVRYLISNGANTKFRNKSGYTPLNYLPLNRNTIVDKDKVVELLSK